MQIRLLSLIVAATAVLVVGCSTPSANSAGTSPAAASAASVQPVAAAPQVSRAAIAPALYELAYSARQHALFAVSAGGFGEDAPASKLLKLEPDTLAVVAEVPLEPSGFGIALDDAANRIYVGQGLDARIAVFDSTTLEPVGSVQLIAHKTKGADGRERFAHHFRQLVLDPANKRLYAPGLSTEGSALYVVDTQALRVEKVVPGFGQVATGIALDPARQRLFVSNLRSGLFEVDTRTLEIRNAYEVAADQLLNLWFDAQSGRLFATDQGLEAINARRQKVDPTFVPHPGNRVVVFDPDSGRITAGIPTDEGPIALRLDAPRHRLFVTNRGGASVTVFDTQTLERLHTIALPDHPNSLAYDDVNQVLYVSVKNGREADREAPESIARIAF
ncbi:hypothetical protein AAV94_09755 [Lampropedia cohaerens]|uniref:YncE family protein n=1 Tax=Lampropedia cohaerens TaxID=1610491 RepID=A0A0U1PYM4_9BURK|nr:hypothetical protein [Lampropedia cohaerens]KKW67567.1 hypothetical protein AAV94_09755 [Lampropedia cohaerens]